MDIYVARQPIFRRDKTLYGYELLFRDGLSNAFPDISGEEATSRLLSNSFLTMGIESIVGTTRAFINFTRDLLLMEVPLMFPAERVVVEILEDVDPDEEVVRACKEMAAQGYALALDDFVFSPGIASLIGLCRIIKFDLRATPIDKLDRILAKISGRWDVKFLAEKVETHQEFERARDMGFEYFQGYFFSKPEVIEGKDISGTGLNLLEIMAKANQEDFDFKELERVIQRDALISYKLMRYINSAYFRRVQEVTSIRQAIVLMGERGIRRFLSLIAMATLAANKPNELIKESIVRARFCEALSELKGAAEKGPELFTVGLFSLIDAIMDQDMASLMDKIPLSAGIKEALVGRKGEFGGYLLVVEGYLKGQWPLVSEQARSMGLDEGALPECFMDSVGWADNLDSL